MSSNNKILVFGISGGIGKATLQSLSERAGSTEIVAVTRKVKADVKELVDSLPNKNVTLVEADMGGDIDSLVKLMEGVSRVYIITPGILNRAEVAINAANAANKASSVTDVLVVSVSSAGDQEKLFGRQFTEIESTIKNLSNIQSTFLRLPMFAENNLGHIGTIKEQNTYYSPVKPDAQSTQITCKDAGVAAANILLNPETYRGKSYNVASFKISNSEMAKVFSSVLGKTVTYTQVPYDAAKQAVMGMGLPEWQVDGIMELNHGIDENDPLLTNENDIDTLKSLLEYEPTSFQKWTESFKSLYL